MNRLASVILLSITVFMIGCGVDNPSMVENQMEIKTAENPASWYSGDYRQGDEIPGVNRYAFMNLGENVVYLNDNKVGYYTKTEDFGFGIYRTFIIKWQIVSTPHGNILDGGVTHQGNLSLAILFQGIYYYDGKEIWNSGDVSNVIQITDFEIKASILTPNTDMFTKIIMEHSYENVSYKASIYPLANAVLSTVPGVSTAWGVVKSVKSVFTESFTVAAKNTIGDNITLYETMEDIYNKSNKKDYMIREFSLTSNAELRRWNTSNSLKGDNIGFSYSVNPPKDRNVLTGTRQLQHQFSFTIKSSGLNVSKKVNIVFNGSYECKKSGNVLKGDVDNSGTVNSLDFAFLRQYLLGMNVAINTEAADMDSSGDVNAIDFALLRTRLLN
ncbi:MAG: hypothetical protein GX639_10960 [Fibrobacter sp.]|nr:hypothetical protein [Fibrobacter sp.]